MTHVQVLAYANITVKFQLRSSINVRLRALSIIGFALKGPPKWVLGDFGGRGKDIWWQPPLNATDTDLRLFRHLVQI